MFQRIAPSGLTLRYHPVCALVEGDQPNSVNAPDSNLAGLVTVLGE